MIKNVLIVDDDLGMLDTITKGLKKYEASFRSLTASNGVTAVEVLKRHIVSIVVTDLKMPKMDGFSLLAYIIEHYPEIPVINMTAYSTPEMQRLARDGGAIAYISKPFLMENLARKIVQVIRKESEGGTLHNVSSGMFLQLIEMEQKTCTIRLVEKKSGRQGVLFFRDGELLEARVDTKQGMEAAYRIFGWDEVNLSIQNTCSQKENRIQSELQPLILEAMRLKDEADTVKPPPKEDQPVPEVKTAAADTLEKRTPTEKLRRRIQTLFGPRCGIRDIYADESWDRWLAAMTGIGQHFKTGQIKAAYIDRNEPNDVILLVKEDVMVLSVDARCPRDRMLQELSD